MRELYLTSESGISKEEIRQAAAQLLAQYPDLRKVLIIPPDFTRCHSYAGEITQVLYEMLNAEGALVHVMPALGTHMAMDAKEKKAFFGDHIPDDHILVHRWQTDTVTLGTVSREVIREISGGLYDTEIEVEVNHLLVDGGYDLILSVGQVVPHEVVGMANYSKNLFVGVGGRAMINKSHMLSAICGMERALGNIDTPARQLYDYAQRTFVDGKIPVVFLQTVTTVEDQHVKLTGLFIGESRKPFEEAAKLSKRQNIVYVKRRAKKVVAYLAPEELKTTWVGNKGIYRTRMIVEDGGELLLLAPGIRAFGENAEMDAVIRKYGYKGRDYVLQLFNQGVFADKIMGAAHLIQGSSDGRFTVTYATCPEQMSREEIESVGYQWMDYREAIKRYDPESLQDGWNVTEDGEEFYYVGMPALGLWKCEEQ